MKSKLVSLLKYSLGIFFIVAACNASAEYYIGDASYGCGCDGFGPPPPEYTTSYHHYRHHYHHYYHHVARRHTYESFRVYYVYQTVPTCGGGGGCGVSACGGGYSSGCSQSSGSGCGSASCDPIDYGPKANMHGASYDWDTRTRDDVY